MVTYPSGQLELDEESDACEDSQHRRGLLHNVKLVCVCVCVCVCVEFAWRLLTYFVVLTSR